MANDILETINLADRPEYIEIVKERSLRRRLIDTCTEIYRNCQDGGLEAKQALDRAAGSMAWVLPSARTGAWCTGAGSSGSIICFRRSRWSFPK